MLTDALGSKPSKLMRALDYPYAIPDASFTLVGGAAAPFAPALRRGRVPVIGYGSNQSPDRLRQKYGTDHTPIPVQRARLADHDVVYSAHLSVYGALPAALRRASGTSVAVAVTWLDADQLVVMHASEAHNYVYAALTGVHLALDDGTVLDSAHAYLGKRGNFAVDGSAVALAAIAAEGRRLTALLQRDALDLARARIAPESDLASFVAATVDDAAERARRIARLAAHAIAAEHPPHIVVHEPTGDERDRG